MWSIASVRYRNACMLLPLDRLVDFAADKKCHVTVDRIPVEGVVHYGCFEDGALLPGQPTACAFHAAKVVVRSVGHFKVHAEDRG